MAGDETPQPPNAEKLIPFSITNKVPVKLDLEKHNFNSWSSFFKIHLGSLGLKSHIEEKASSSVPDHEWCKLDDLIKMWILGSLCDSLQEQVVSTPGFAKDLWDHLESLFHDNKDARAINLDNELRSIKIGNMTINEYCTKIKSMADRLKNLGSPVSEKNLVIYAVNGLDSRFATIVKIIRHREPLPSFETARTMLLLDESTMNEAHNSGSPLEGSTSSQTVLLATKTHNKNTSSNSQNKPQEFPQLCNHFNKGNCKFGDRCKFIHDHRNRAGLNTKSLGRHQLMKGMGNSPGFHAPTTTWAPPGLYSSRLAHYSSQPTAQHLQYQHPPSTAPTHHPYAAQPTLPQAHFSAPLQQQQEYVVYVHGSKKV
ncbi:hypothetical protein CTI12_AA128900 [Artemisia annua]|uniref:C3H1-type domain-containing protein n=1 Tax=Artemisia annua TaxID=35608 RepID=A0A2U1PP78_ARTAN|nr:hypothetical protein CTI12_AA128900 [Artemisia annua]